MAKESFVEQPLVLTHILQSDFLLLVSYSMRLRPFLFSFLLFLFQSFLLFKINLFFFFHCHCRISRGFFFPLVSAPSIFSFLQSLDSHYSQLILAMFFLLISSDLKECCLHLNSKYDFLPQSRNIIYAFLMLFVNLGRQQRRLYM